MSEGNQAARQKCQHCWFHCPRSGDKGQCQGCSLHCPGAPTVQVACPDETCDGYVVAVRRSVWMTWNYDPQADQNWTATIVLDDHDQADFQLLCSTETPHDGATTQRPHLPPELKRVTSILGLPAIIGGVDSADCRAWPDASCSTDL